ncbi:hypothetical protein GA0061083_3461 [Pseudarthrobacter enclensis]|uniref:DUF5666 domain-containing protein n=1 Tax=Pseudarthrobacter enclensis TaxID=993070 RepID=A0A0V8ID31_9MICC|nr:hypothetical protein [Pseudarthrobacter enclensis]KSU72683.1 hypothetical protein AS031_15550 [Pseudarthrobacter enclensis]SCC22596.1 hypothetical protein GA0061083_3461 [Pseudarthrobacter enclensis]
MAAQYPGVRKALIAGAVALALTGTGAALAWSVDSPSPSPSDSSSAPAPPPGQEKQSRQDKAERPRFQHGESVVRKADGTFQTVLQQQGTVEAAGSTSVTVKSEDGFSQEYAVTADTRISSVPPASGDQGSTDDDGRRLRPADGTIADIAAGDVVRISGIKDGGRVTARTIVEGAAGHPGLGLGRGHGNGHGKGLGRGHGHGNAGGTSSGAGA